MKSAFFGETLVSMNKNDFNKIIENGYTKAISKFSDPQYVTEFLSKHANDDNKISTESKVKAIIVDKLGVDEAEVKPEASFTNDLGADSLDTVELIMEFEKEFGISIPDDKAEKIGTVGDAIAYIEENAK